MYKRASLARYYRDRRETMADWFCHIHPQTFLIRNDERPTNQYVDDQARFHCPDCNREMLRRYLQKAYDDVYNKGHILTKGNSVRYRGSGAPKITHQRAS